MKYALLYDRFYWIVTAEIKASMLVVAIFFAKMFILSNKLQTEHMKYVVCIQ